MTNNDILIEFMKTHSNNEAAAHFEVNVRTIARWLKKLGYTYHDLKVGVDAKLNSDQFNFIIGSLLGDGCISQNRFSIKQKEDRSEYIDYAYQTLQPFSSNTVRGESLLKGKYFPYSQTYSHTHDIFKNLKTQWYKDKQKIIPKSLFLNESIFTHWFVQDGTHRYSHRYYVLSTQSFIESDIDLLIYILKRDLNVKSHKTKKKNKWEITIDISEYEKVFDILNRNITWNCFRYKSDTGKIKKIKTWLGANKLSKFKAEQIREFYELGYKVNYLANKFKVSISSIRNVINNLTYKVKKKCITLGGTSLIDVVYNPKANTSSIAELVLEL